MSPNHTITTTTSKPKKSTTQEPAEQKTNPNPKPSKNSLKKVVTTEPPLADDEEEEEETSNGQGKKDCEGDCVNGLVALFCDDIDSEAFCPSDESCCITRTSDASKKPPTPGKPEKKTSPPPPKNKIPIVTSPRPPPPSQTSSISGDLLSQIWNIAETTLTNNLSPAQAQSPPPPQKCPGFCLLNIMAAFCERPSVVVPYPTSCKNGNICCDNTRAPPRRPPPPPPTTPAPVTPPPDPREECPGSCIVSLLSFTCFSEYIFFFNFKQSNEKY